MNGERMKELKKGEMKYKLFPSFITQILEEVLTTLFQVIVLTNRVHFIRIIIFQRRKGTLGIKKYKIKGKISID